MAFPRPVVGQQGYEAKMPVSAASRTIEQVRTEVTGQRRIQETWAGLTINSCTA
jgi:hypothetical protein